jgi:hypothetical protein
MNFTLSDLPSTVCEYVPERSRTRTEGVFQMLIISYSTRISRLQPMGLCERNVFGNKLLGVRKRS